MPLHADNAVKTMFIAQIAVLVAGAGAVAMFLADPFPKADAIIEARAVSGDDRSLRPDERRAPGDEEPTFEHTDWRVVLPSISWAAPDPVRRAPEVQEDEAGIARSDAGEGPETLPEPVEAPPSVNWRYIGYIRQSESALALLTVDARQRFVSVGETLQNHRIVAISPDAITINDGRRDQRIEMAVRTEMVGRPAPGAAVGPYLPTNQLFRPGEEETDYERRLEQIQREREREREQRRQNPTRAEEWIPS